MKINVRKIFIGVILAICIFAINISVFIQITEKSKRIEKENEIIVDTVLLTENFENIFDNQIDYQNYSCNVAKVNYYEELIYTNYTNQEKSENDYELNVNIPHININNSEAEKINAEIDNMFYEKAKSILAKTNQNVIYNVKYKAYINDNILSLVISASIKESQNAQRIIMKTYNYNLSSNSRLSLYDIIQYRSLAVSKVQDKINETIKMASEDAVKYNELGYDKYLRDIDNSIYKIENTVVYFIGKDKAVYIIYPYGNSEFTSEYDLLVI